MAKYKIIPSSRTIVQSPISIGHKAEKGVQAIEFDLTAWVETYGSGTLTVIMRRWGDEIPYPIALEIGEDNKATWTLSDIDTAKAGMAYAQLNYIVGDEVVKKSDIYTFRVMDSLAGEGEPPEAYESWLEQLTHLAAEAMAEVLDIEGIVTDKTLSVDGGIADAKKTGDEISAIKADLEDLDDRVDALEAGGSGSGLTADIKEALLACFQHVKFQDDNNDYYQDLYDALYPPADLVSISAVYTQSGTVYDTDSLDGLKSDLVVTAFMSDQTTRTVTDYTLSGSLTEGTSVITVTYGGKTTTFNVTVTVLPDERVLLYNWDFTESLTDTVEGVTAVLGANSGVTSLERTSAGVSFTAPTQRIAFPTSIAMDMSGKTLEIDVSNFDFEGSLDYHIRFVLLNENINTSNSGWGPIIYRKDTGWAAYGTKSASSTVGAWSENWNNNLGINAFDNKTVKLVFDLDGHTTSLYLDNELIGTLTTIYYSNTKHRRLLIGGVNANGGTEAEGNQCYDMTITGVRIYQNAAETSE